MQDDEADGPDDGAIMACMKYHVHVCDGKANEKVFDLVNVWLQWFREETGAQPVKKDG